MCCSPNSVAESVAGDPAEYRQTILEWAGKQSGEAVVRSCQRYVNPRLFRQHHDRATSARVEAKQGNH